MTFSGSKLKLALAVGALPILLFSYHYYSNWWTAKKNAKAAQEAQALPHLKIQSQLEDLRLHGTSLPPCPLIFPLLDSKGHVTPLGSYLSYWAMDQAAYRPQAALSLSNLDRSFEDFDLFNPNRAASDAYKTQLPLRFNTKDFGEGAWKKTFKGWKLHLRFWGTKPEKTYDQTFRKGDLHQAPSWIAASLEDYLGETPTAEEAAYRDQPIFTNDDDFIRGSKTEELFEEGGGSLVTHWQDLVAKNPDRPELAIRWIEAMDAPNAQTSSKTLETLLGKNPTYDLLSRSLAWDYFTRQQVTEALSLWFNQLKKDDNNISLYSGATLCLNYLGEENLALQLDRLWTQKHPDNPMAWMQLANQCFGYIDLPHRGEQPPASATPTGPVFAKDQEGLAAARKFAQLSPQDTRAWVWLMQYAVKDKADQSEIETDFQKAIQINPKDDQAYQAYLAYLEMQGIVGAQETWDFVKESGVQHPFLVYLYFSQQYKGNGSGQAPLDIKSKENKSLLKRALQADLKLYPASMSLWGEYLYWAGLWGNTSDVLNFAQTLAENNSKLKALPPTLTLQALSGQTSADAVSQMTGAYQALLALDDQDWNRWNIYAKFCVENHLDAEAKKAITAIGDNWDESVWPQADLDKARVDLGLDPIPAPPGGLSVVSPTASTSLTPVSPSASAIPKANP
jgi:hypothetical protein